MGEYFYFRNDSRRESNQHVIRGFGTKFIAKLFIYNQEEIKEFFEEVIRMNGWGANESIYALGDSGNIFEWSDYQNI